MLSCPSIDLRLTNRAFRPLLLLRRQLAPPTERPISAVVPAVRLASPAEPSGLTFDRTRQLSLATSISGSASRLVLAAQPFRLTFNTAGQLAPPTASPDLPSCFPIGLRRPVSLSASPSVPSSACAENETFSSAFLPCRSACAARQAFQPYLPT